MTAIPPLTGPFDLGNRVILSPAPAWIKEEQITKEINFAQRAHTAQAPFAFIAEYEADSLGEPDPEWKGSQTRSKQDIAAERLLLANLALWLARPSRTMTELVIHAEQRGRRWFLRSLSEHSPPLPHQRDNSNFLSEEHLQLGRELNEALASLPRDGAVWIAASMLWKALTEKMWHVRYLLLWVALEALFGPEDAREITYRLSHRVAFFLKSNNQLTKDLFNLAKTGYGWRSKVVHGMRLAKLTPEKSEQLMYEAEDLIRKASNQILSDPTLIKKFSGKEREPYLDDLIFSP